MSQSTSVYVESAAAGEVLAAAVKAEEETGVSVIGDSTWAQDSETATLPPPYGTLRLSTEDRRDILRFLIGSQAIEGVDVPYNEAERILEQVLREPLPDIR